MLLNEIRCNKCGKLLGRFEGIGTIKCTRPGCYGKNIYNTNTGVIKYIPSVSDMMRNRTTSSGCRFH